MQITNLTAHGMLGCPATRLISVTVGEAGKPLGKTKVDVTQGRLISGATAGIQAIQEDLELDIEFGLLFKALAILQTNFVSDTGFLGARCSRLTCPRAEYCQKWVLL